MNLKDQIVTVMGLGLHGGAVGTVKWLVEQGARVTVTDLKTEDELKPSLDALREAGVDFLTLRVGKGSKRRVGAVQLVLGQHREQDFTEAYMIVRNPAVPRDSKYLKMAREAGVKVEMDSGLFFEHCPSKNIIGVTGSKGKTTTTKVITQLLKLGGLDVVEVGVEGISPLAELKNISPEATVVFELSSWRLEDLDEKKMSPATAVVTSLYRDHLNTYDSFDDYVEAKKTIMKYQGKNDVVLLNADDELVREWAKEVPGEIFWYSINNLFEGEGIFVKNEGRKATPLTQPSPHKGRGQLGRQIMVRMDGIEEQLLPLSAVALQSEHERRNVLPGILLASLAGVKPSKLEKVVGQLTPLPHRLEVVRKLDGVSYINDSSATMPDATIAALRSFAGQSIIHILGGNDKELVFDELAEVETASNVKAVILLPGNATEKIKRALTNAFQDRAPEVFEIEDMEEAVGKARELAEVGDVVLLSPAATSFATFVNEFDRGDKFREIVLGLR